MSEKWSPRQQRHLCFVAEFTTDIRYVRGVDNVVADILSRATYPEPRTVSAMNGVGTNVLDYAEMAKQQADCHESVAAIPIDRVRCRNWGITLI